MKVPKNILQVALSVTLGSAIVLATTTADARKRDGAPPHEQRDVVVEATTICLGTPSGYAALDNACALLSNSDGFRSGAARGCTEDFAGAGVVAYSGRNCDSNEESLMRYAASAVLSLDDVVNGNASQSSTATGYLCGHADKYEALLGAGKVAPVFPDVDLGEDARDIVTIDLGLSCDI